LEKKPPAKTFSWEEGDKCPSGCGGRLTEYKREGSCGCHITAPCASCEGLELVCDVCGLSRDEHEADLAARARDAAETEMRDLYRSLSPTEAAGLNRLREEFTAQMNWSVLDDQTGQTDWTAFADQTRKHMLCGAFGAVLEPQRSRIKTKRSKRCGR